MRTLIAVLVFVLIVAAGFAASSCGKGKGVSSPDFGSGGDGGFYVEPYGSGDADPSQSGKLAANVLGENESGRLEVAVDVSDAAGFKSALLHLHYDSRRYSPVIVRDGGFLPNAIFMGVTRLPDIVPIASVLANPDRSVGVNGGGRIAIVEFEQKSYSGERRISVVPNNLDNIVRSPSIIDDSVAKVLSISFTEQNLGDYDLNAEVSVADVTPVALRYLDTVTTGNPANDPVAVVDGDNNGEVGIGDITPIALNYLNTVDAYSIRWGIDDGSGNVTPKGDLPNLDSPGSPYSVDRVYTGDGLRPRYTYVHDYGSDASYSFPDGNNLRYWIRPYSQGAFGIEGGPFYLGGGGGGGDTDPPAWLSGFGIISAQYNTDNTAVDIVFGEAEDADSPPVTYFVYWQEGDILDYADALANGRVFSVDVSAQTSPYTYSITTADGVTVSQDTTLSIAVHARDSAEFPNETPVYNPHPIHPGGADWLVAVPGEPPVDNPPTWLVTIGITEAQPGNTYADIGWGLAFHADGDPSYEVYWLEGDFSLSPTTVFLTGNHTNVTGATQYRVTGLTNGQIYTFGVRAKSPLGTEDNNVRVLTATPQESVFPFKVPADGKYYPGAASTDSDIVLTPFDNAPVIVYTTDGAGGTGYMYLCYFDGLDWIHEEIAAVEGYFRFDHPSVEIVGNTIIVSAYNRESKAMEVYRWSTDNPLWVMETVDTESQQGGEIYGCLASSMEYEPNSQALGIVYNARVNAQYSILKYAYSVAGGPWSTEIIQDASGNDDVPGASFVFTPGGEPSAAYTYGYFDWSAQAWDCLVYYATRTDGIWTSEKIPGDWMATQPIFLTYNTATDMPFIAFGRDRYYELYPGYSVWLIDAVAAWKDGTGAWQDEIIEEGDGYFSVDPPAMYIRLAGADPSIGFNKAGQAFLYYSTIEIEDLDTDPPIYSQLTQCTFDGTSWAPYDRLDPLRQGCSATNMAIDVAESRVVYQQVGVLYPADTEILNDFPPGELTYWQF